MIERVYIDQTPSVQRIAVVAATWECNPNTTKETFAEEFRRNESRAMRDYGAEPMFSVEGYFKNREQILVLANKEREDPWDSATNEWKPWFRGGSYEYYCHFDLSESRDATGFAVAHYETETERVVLDALRVFQPRRGMNIDFAELRELVYSLSDRGFYIACVSYDKFQSTESRQVLQKKGYRVALISVDASYNIELTRPLPDASGKMRAVVKPSKLEIYDTFQEHLLSGRLDYFTHPTLIRELQGLELYAGSRIDHGRDGSKDLADAAAIVTWQCAVNKSTREAAENQPVRSQHALTPGQYRALTRALKGPKQRLS